ncbi:hypothetical protein D3C77_264780 [compost metagenome]
MYQTLHVDAEVAQQSKSQERLRISVLGFLVNHESNFLTSIQLLVNVQINAIGTGNDAVRLLEITQIDLGILILEKHRVKLGSDHCCGAQKTEGGYA